MIDTKPITVKKSLTKMKKCSLALSKSFGENEMSLFEKIGFYFQNLLREIFYNAKAFEALLNSQVRILFDLLYINGRGDLADNYEYVELIFEVDLKHKVELIDEILAYISENEIYFDSQTYDVVAILTETLTKIKGTQTQLRQESLKSEVENQISKVLNTLN